ncbi:MAG: hypothetical protein Q4D88_01640 [Anaerococcus sp.]|nr:hypothetical protein [Anaerococcus sp.]
MKNTDTFTLDDCSKREEFSIDHKSIPIKLSKDLDEAIKYLLWYVPNISSEQSRKDDLLKNPEYDDYIFEEIKRQMNLEDKDILISEKIDKELSDHFRGEVCVNEQKLIMTLADGNETKTMALLRHIRNAIAHGNFNVIHNLVIGFDVKKYQDFLEYRGIFKINPSNLLKALRKINMDFTSEEFIAKALRRAGYKVEAFQEEYQRSHRFDLFAKKKDRRFAIEIINLDFRESLDENFVKDMIRRIKGIDSSIKPILIINSSYLSEKSKEDLIANDLIILDIKNIKKMNQGRDMIGEIVRKSEIYKNL